jgi:heme A synthase
VPPIRYTPLQNSQPDNLKNEPEPKNHEYECLIAEYTGRLAARLLVVATLLLALFGFWQVMVSRDTARRQLRAYVLGAAHADEHLQSGRHLSRNGGREFPFP